MGKTPVLKSLRKKAKSVKLAERWLRLLVEQPICNGGYSCPRCRGFTAESRTGKCPWCETALVSLDEAFWRKVSDSIRRALRRDPELLSRIKAESSGYPTPRWPGPLSWIADAWRRAGKPPGRPMESVRPYRIDFWVRALRQAKGLSQEEACEALDRLIRGDPEHLGPEARVWREKISQHLSALGLDPRDLKRNLAWVRRQREDILARWSGERVRARGFGGVRLT